MAQWEEEAVYKYKPVELLLYKRYIDNVIIWKGTKEKLVIFLDGLKQNDINIPCECYISKTTISYLDLEIMQVNNKLSTKTHFKNVDYNSYLPVESCHH